MIGDFTSIFWLIIKAFTLLGFAIYTVFAIVIVRQERLMSAVIEEGFEPVIKSLAIIHLLGSIALFFFALILL
jgi:hypothetical protein